MTHETQCECVSGFQKGILRHLLPEASEYGQSEDWRHPASAHTTYGDFFSNSGAQCVLTNALPVTLRVLQVIPNPRLIYCQRGHTAKAVKRALDTCGLQGREARLVHNSTVMEWTTGSR